MDDQILLQTELPAIAAPDGSTTIGPGKSLKLIDLEHPEHKILSAIWTRLTLLYAGGWALEQKCGDFLRKRPKELPTVYVAREEAFTYKNHMGTALDWYLSEMFQEDPHIEPTKADGKPDASDESKAFYTRFLSDCDRAGTSFVDIFRQIFQYVLLYKSAFVMLDLPYYAPGTFANLMEQKAANAFDQYLTVFAPTEVINWEYDDQGNLEWVVIKQSFRRTKFAEAEQHTVDRWSYYDKQTFQIWERVRNSSETIPPADAHVTLVRSGSHLLAKANQVPVMQLKVPEGLWLANRAYLAAIDHLNADNVLAWALFMSALAMPVVISNEEPDMSASETGYIHLPEGSDYKWSEPEGHSFKHMSDRIDELKEDIFRAFYLIHQGRSGRATPTAQSGVSKQLDMMPSKDILKMFGDLIRAFMVKVLGSVAKARGEENGWDISGFNFKDDMSDEEVQMFTDFLALDIPSERLNKVIYKRLAQRAAADASYQTLSAINEEIDSSPDKMTRELNQMNQRGMLQAKLSGAEASATGKTGEPGAGGKPNKPSPPNPQNEKGKDVGMEVGESDAQ